MKRIANSEYRVSSIVGGFALAAMLLMPQMAGAQPSDPNRCFCNAPTGGSEFAGSAASCAECEATCRAASATMRSFTDGTGGSMTSCPAETGGGIETRRCSFQCIRGGEPYQPAGVSPASNICNADSVCAAVCASTCAALGAGVTCGTSPAPRCTEPTAAPAAPARSTGGGRYGLVNPLGTVSLPVILGRFVKAAVGLVGALFLVMFIYGGFIWMTAGGDSKRVVTARKTLINAVLGILVVALSYTFVSVVFQYVVSLGS